MVSFAIWQKIDKTQKPKFGMGDISHFDNIEKLNIKSFEIELKDIGAKNPIIIAFGNDCFKILNELKEKYTIFKVPHYSSCISKEQLRDAFN